MAHERYGRRRRDGAVKFVMPPARGGTNLRFTRND